jgi:glutamate-5-semialdehyde dehydrogenase
MISDTSTMRELATQAKQAAYAMAQAPTQQKNDLLHRMAEALEQRASFLLEENQKDLLEANQRGLSAAMLDRLRLTASRITKMAEGCNEVAALPDPVYELSDFVSRPSGIKVGRMRIPLGLVAIIYESRPNVTADAAALCLKSGNGVILRGGSEALHSNRAIIAVLHQVLQQHGLPPQVVSFVDTPDRAAMLDLLQLEEVIDLVIPRGGEGLIRFVAEHSRIPVIKHYKGTCHIFVDAAADLDMATKITVNAKVDRPGVCNAVETLLVHQAVAATFLPRLQAALAPHQVTLRGCPRTMDLLPDIERATEEDWPAEYLDLILAIKIVDHLEQAVAHIRQHGSLHTESIITNDHAAAMAFLHQVDSSSVMINASTRFADGGEYGLGAEIGISTSKLHAYGPMGLRELTTQKFVVFGQGEVRSS